MINNKKGLTISTLGKIMLMLAVVIVVSLVFLYPLREKGKQARGLYDSGDCDMDNVWNAIDRCPCLSTGGLEDNKLRGCPLGTAVEEANRDKQTCSWFATREQSCSGLSTAVCYEKEDVAFLSNCEKENKEKCIEKEEGGYKKRCDLVSEIAIGVPLVEEAGLAGKWDLIVSEFVIPDSKENADFEDDGNAEFDLRNLFKNKPTKITVTVKNQGEQNIPKPFLVSVSVCNENKKESTCKEIGNKLLSPLNAGNEEKFDLEIIIGTEGDACDGEGDTRCFVRVKADSENALQELDKANNNAWFFVWLKNKRMEEVSWKKFKSIEIFADEGEGSEYTKIIKTVCPGFMGKDCDTEDDDCNDEGEALLELPPQGCLVHASEDNDVPGVENDCGWAQAKITFVLTHTDYREIERIGGVQTTDGENVEDLFTYKWQAKSEGSLICGDDQHWHLCDKDRSGNVLLVGGERFGCSDQIWKKI